ncbi:MAG: hypothetical protein JSS72_11870 [Armatimonadetes bacterium]|nr:hypothetical protein [Armatimonadota bacterium]
MLNAFLISLLVAGFAALPILNLLVKLKSRQTINQYAPEGHQVKQGTPTMGGLIILTGFFAAVIYMLVSNPAYAQTFLVPQYAILAIGFALVGFLDDYVVPKLMTGKRGLGWKQKLLMELLFCAPMALWGGGHGALQAGLLVFTVLFFSNAYNFSDGLDGLAGSLLLCICLGLYFLVPDARWAVLAMVGGAIPFLFLNAPPARVFMGDVGALPIGAVLGAVVFQGLSKAPDQAHLNALALLSLVMVVELVPVPLQIASVKLRGKRLFPYTPVHHSFEKAGWPESRVVWTFVLSQLVLTLLALCLIGAGT